MNNIVSKRNIWKLAALLTLTMLSVNVCVSQHIKRKGSLGISFYRKSPDSLVQKLSYKQGAIVQYSVANTSASAMDIKAHDIITQINTTPIIKPDDIFTAAKSLREGDKLAITIIRNNKTIKLAGKVVGLPVETSKTADIVYGEFAYKDGYVRTIYKTLKGRKPLGTIYFLQGLPCYSMDNFKEQDNTKQAIDAMVDRGFAVYRMEKADMGDNMNMPPCEKMGYDDELAMYRAGYENLLRFKNVDTSKIFLFGHSMGGVTAPLLTDIFQPKGIVVYGTVFKPWLEYLFDAYLIQLQYYGEDLAGLRDTIEAIKPFVYDYFYKNVPVEEICKTKEGEYAMAVIMSYNAQTGLSASGRSPLCHKELNGHNLAKAWKNTTSNVLAIYGECDIAATHPDDHIALVNYVNKLRPGTAKFWQAPKTTHLFEEIGTMQEFIAMQNDPVGFAKYASTRFNSKVFDFTCNWMKEVLDAQK